MSNYKVFKLFYCLNKLKSINNYCMRNFLNFKNKYNLSFMLKPLLILSIISSVFYVLKIINFSYADEMMLFCVMTFIILTFIKNDRNLKHIFIMLSIVIALCIFYICLYDDFILFLANKCKNSGIKFGFFNAFFNTIGLNKFENLIYHTSYGGSKFIDGNIITGAIDIFKSKRNVDECSMFLCGKYLSLFSLIGVSLSFNKNKKEILIITLFAVLTGNLNIYLLTLLLLYTPYYFVFLLFNFISYFLSDFLNVNSGFFYNGSLFELIIQKDNLVYILAVGMLLCAVSYYISRLVNEKLKC